MRTIAPWETRGPRDNSRRLPNRANAQHAGSYIHVGKQGPADREGNTSPPNLTVAVEWYAGMGDCCLNSSAGASSHEHTHHNVTQSSRDTRTSRATSRRLAAPHTLPTL